LFVGVLRYFLCSSLSQQRAHLITSVISQRCDRLSGYPCEEQAKYHIDGEIDHNIYCVAHACVMKIVVKEYVQGLHNQHLPHDQSKALFPQKLCKLVAKQAVIAKAAMYADNHEACSKCIERNHVYEAWQQNGREQSHNATHGYK
jgi:hypothetical protein